MYNKSIIYENVISFESLLNTGYQCLHGVQWKSSVQLFKINMQQWIANLHRELENGTYRSKGFYEFTINERGKTREIKSVHISERCVQKSLCQNALIPLIVPRLIYDNSASIPGRGLNHAISRLKMHLRYHYKMYGREGGILIADFSNYFGSIDHAILIQKLDKIIEDKRILNLTSYFINCFSGDKGLGLGSEISQICAMYYLNDMDHFIKEQLHIKAYARYNDDFYLIHPDIEYLKYCLQIIDQFALNLGLKLNTKRTKIIPLTQSFTYLKKHISLNKNGKIQFKVSKKTVTKTKRVLKKQKKLLLNNKITFENIRNSYNSRRGFMNQYNMKMEIRELDKKFNELFIEDFISGKEKY